MTVRNRYDPIYIKKKEFAEENKKYSTHYMAEHKAVSEIENDWKIVLFLILIFIDRFALVTLFYRQTYNY